MRSRTSHWEGACSPSPSSQLAGSPPRCVATPRRAAPCASWSHCAAVRALAPSRLGSVTVLGTPSNLIFEEMPLPGTAPAALVYAELLTTGGERAREAAEIVRSRYLPGFL